MKSPNCFHLHTLQGLMSDATAKDGSDGLPVVVDVKMCVALLDELADLEARYLLMAKLLHRTDPELIGRLEKCGVVL